MKCSEAWLREWVNLNIDRSVLCNLLTMSGLEVEEVTPVSAHFTGVVVGHVIEVDKHPKAERLSVCKVNVGNEILKIVCGAPNVHSDMKVAVARVNAKLGDQIISNTSIRGITSQGMICSAKELGLSEEGAGILELPADSTIGVDLQKLLQLDDYIIHLSITPNRGDCLSIQGIAREVAALTHSTLTPIKYTTHSPETKASKIIHIEAEDVCPSYVGRVIENVKADTSSPLWLQEKLRRSGLRSINAIVDVMNYVMIELGQPLHAFDNQTIDGDIKVRWSKTDEQLKLLDGKDCKFDNETLVIADKNKVLAMAGIMGGLSSSVTLNTQSIFLESAFFKPQTIARAKQYYQIQSDAAYRYERGVDPEIQLRALERATQLIIAIVGGKVGPIMSKINQALFPPRLQIKLNKTKIDKVLGLAIPENEIIDILNRLYFKCDKELPRKSNYQITVPSFRFDITRAEDLIEEVARVYGYDKIPTTYNKGELLPKTTAKKAILTQNLRQILSKQAFYEVITYSFVEEKLVKMLDTENKHLTLSNPISGDMAVMRTSLLPGLFNVLLYNLNRQQESIKIFEIANCFVSREGAHKETERLAGLVSGFALPEQWGVAARTIDFYDLKGVVENVFSYLHCLDEVTFIPAKCTFLHPGQSAKILFQKKDIGYVGQVHPLILKKLDLKNNIYVFELDILPLTESKVLHYKPISKFPEIRRDIAIIVNQAIPVKNIQDTIRKLACDWLKDVFIFDVYQGKGIAPGYKSVAVALVLQHPSRTLIDDEVNLYMDNVIKALKEQIGAELRS